MPRRIIGANPVLSIARLSFPGIDFASNGHGHPNIDELGNAAITCDNAGVQENNVVVCSGCPGGLVLFTEDPVYFCCSTHADGRGTPCYVSPAPTAAPSAAPTSAVPTSAPTSSAPTSAPTERGCVGSSMSASYWNNRCSGGESRNSVSVDGRSDCWALCYASSACVAVEWDGDDDECKVYTALPAEGGSDSDYHCFIKRCESAAPTARPTTAQPTAAPSTPGPTVSDATFAPTVGPTTPSPTMPPATSDPTPSPSTPPTTSAPTAAPSTARPTGAPTTPVSTAANPTPMPPTVTRPPPTTENADGHDDAAAPSPPPVAAVAGAGAGDSGSDGDGATSAATVVGILLAAVVVVGVAAWLLRSSRRHHLQSPTEILIVLPMVQNPAWHVGPAGDSAAEARPPAHAPAYATLPARTYGTQPGASAAGGAAVPAGVYSVLDTAAPGRGERDRPSTVYDDPFVLDASSMQAEATANPAPGAYGSLGRAGQRQQQPHTYASIGNKDRARAAARADAQGNSTYQQLDASHVQYRAPQAAQGGGPPLPQYEVVDADGGRSSGGPEYAAIEYAYQDADDASGSNDGMYAVPSPADGSRRGVRMVRVPTVQTVPGHSVSEADEFC